MSASHISRNVARQVKSFRSRLGVEVTFGAAQYRVISEIVAGNNVGVQALPQAVLGVFLASADPRVFMFDPGDFVPTTLVNPPQEGDLLVFHNLNYLVTHVAWEDLAEDTQQIMVFAYRKIL